MSSADIAVDGRRKRILQVGYYDSLVQTRTALLENHGYDVTSVLGNAGAMALETPVLASVDLVLIGFSSAYDMRSTLLQWFKQNHANLPVVVMQSHAFEKFPGADAAALSESPDLWLAAVARCLTSTPGSR